MTKELIKYISDIMRSAVQAEIAEGRKRAIRRFMFGDMERYHVDVFVDITPESKHASVYFSFGSEVILDEPEKKRLGQQLIESIPSWDDVKKLQMRLADVFA